MNRRILAVILIAAVTLLAVGAFAQAKKTEKAKDPVCGIMVDKDPDLSTSYAGETYYFCSRADMDTFKKNPEKYVKKR